MRLKNEEPKAGTNLSGSPLQGSACSVVDPGLRPLRVLALGCSVPRFQRLPQSCGDRSHSSLFYPGSCAAAHGEFIRPLTAETLKARDRTAQGGAKRNPGCGIPDHIKPCKGGTYWLNKTEQGKSRHCSAIIEGLLIPKCRHCGLRFRSDLLQGRLVIAPCCIDIQLYEILRGGITGSARIGLKGQHCKPETGVFPLDGGFLGFLDRLPLLGHFGFLAWFATLSASLGLRLIAASTASTLTRLGGS
jgi:hypothetical protein